LRLALRPVDVSPELPRDHWRISATLSTTGVSGAKRREREAVGELLPLAAPLLDQVLLGGGHGSLLAALDGRVFPKELFRPPPNDGEALRCSQRLRPRAGGFRA
jgi:hypothetical protein